MGLRCSPWLLLSGRKRLWDGGDGTLGLTLITESNCPLRRRSRWQDGRRVLADSKELVNAASTNATKPHPDVWFPRRDRDDIPHCVPRSLIGQWKRELMDVRRRAWRARGEGTLRQGLEIRECANGLPSCNFILSREVEWNESSNLELLTSVNESAWLVYSARAEDLVDIYLEPFLILLPESHDSSWERKTLVPKTLH